MIGLWPICAIGLDRTAVATKTHHEFTIMCEDSKYVYQYKSKKIVQSTKYKNKKIKKLH